MKSTDCKLARTRPLAPRTTLLFALIALAACATPPPDNLAPTMPLEQAITSTMVEVSRGGKVAENEAEAAWEPEIIYICDRHSLNPGYHRLRPQLEAVQRDNRLMVDYLARRGFGLLGCEFRFGVLKEEPDTKRQYQIVRSRLKFDHPNYLDGFSIFQPIRHQLANANRLQVWGVEDEELYDKDVAYLLAYRKATKYAKRRDLTPQQRRKALETALQAADDLDGNLRARGRAAAENLLKAMEVTGEERAVLILGGAHRRGVESVLEESGRRYLILESPSYDRHVEKKDS